MKIIHILYSGILYLSLCALVFPYNVMGGARKLPDKYRNGRGTGRPPVPPEGFSRRAFEDYIRAITEMDFREEPKNPDDMPKTSQGGEEGRLGTGVLGVGFKLGGSTKTSIPTSPTRTDQNTPTNGAPSYKLTAIEQRGKKDKPPKESFTEWSTRMQIEISKTKEIRKMTENLANTLTSYTKIEISPETRINFLKAIENNPIIMEAMAELAKYITSTDFIWGFPIKFRI